MLQLRPPITPREWCTNINALSIDYAFRPRLRDRLTLGGMTFPRKPLAYGEEDSHFFYRYSCLDNHFHIVQASLRSPFNLAWNARLPMINPKEDHPAASVTCLSPVHYRRRSARLVSYYALFK